MFLKDKVIHRQQLVFRINELRELIRSGGIQEPADIDNAVSRILKYIEKLQELNLFIKSANDQAKINFHGKSLSLSTALEIRNTLSEKLKIINELINGCHGLNYFDLISSRNSMEEELNGINRLIDMADWSVKIG